jgi:hypothetical protein
MTCCSRAVWNSLGFWVEEFKCVPIPPKSWGNEEEEEKILQSHPLLLPTTPLSSVTTILARLDARPTGDSFDD